MIINPEKTVAFTGYRTEKILQSNPRADIFQTIDRRLDRTIAELIAEGYDTFLSGMAVGFDMMAAKAVLRAKVANPHIKLVAVIPFSGQELRYNAQDRQLYADIFHQADDIKLMANGFGYQFYLMRNDFLVDNSSVVVCFYDGLRGGTQYTFTRARNENRRIINLTDSLN